ncbi:MAG: HAMP domain-containing protein [Chloroflexia bacterium]|nr:HAMP domain-containing protein [Chloroflexia bacterium]
MSSRQRQGSIRNRLLGGYLLTTLLALLIGGFAYRQLHTVQRLFHKTEFFREEVRYVSARLEGRTLAISSLVQEYFLWQDPAEKRRVRTLLEDEFLVAEELVRQLGQRVETAEEQAVLAQVKEVLPQYQQWALEVLDTYDEEGSFGKRTEWELRAFNIAQGQLLDVLAQLRLVEQSELVAAWQSVNNSVNTALITILGFSVAMLLFAALAGFYVSSYVLRPLRHLRQGAQAFGEGALETTITIRSRDEFEELAATFNQMAQHLRQSQAQLQSWGEQLEQEVVLRTGELEDMVQKQKDLLGVIREMSTPVMPVYRGVLVMPLVGIIDQSRALDIMENLLAMIEKSRARMVILDITGVPVVDTTVAQALLQAAQAAGLLGTEAILVGVSPQVADTLVSLGTDLSGLVTRADLQSGIAYALSRVIVGSKSLKGG